MLAGLPSIWALIAGQRLRFAGAVAALVAASCFLYLLPLVPQITIDGVLRPEDAGPPPAFVAWVVERLGGRAHVAGNLWLPALLVLACTILAGVFIYLRGQWSAQASEAVARTTRDRLYDRLQHLPCAWFDRAETGDLIQRCTSDVETVRAFLSLQAVEMGRAVIMLVVPLPLMLMIDVPMTLVSVALVPLIGVFAAVFYAKVKFIFRLTDEAEGRMTATLQENLTGIRVVRAFARQDFERERFRARNEAHRQLDYRLYRLMSWFWSSSDLLCFLQLALVAGAGAWWLASGRLDVGAYYFFVTAVAMFVWPVRMAGRMLTELGKALVALGRIREVLEAAPEDGPAAAAARGRGAVGEAARGEIELEGVSFAHEPGRPVLSDVSFTAAPGETVALLGPSGCGKSTIVSLLLRLYDQDAGTIRLDGRDLRELDRTWVRGQIAAVMQEPFLYSRTLRENLLLGRPEAPEEEMIEAAQSACVHESILRFDHGYEALVGERGVTLSGGQRQRVALARALIQRPAILVLDDALSAVDTETEGLILRALEQRHGRQTTILVAHRISSLMHADRILVMEHGRITQRGTHRALIEAPGLYRRLWALQARESGAPEDGRGAGFADAAAHRSPSS